MVFSDFPMRRDFSPAVLTGLALPIIDMTYVEVNGIKIVQRFLPAAGKLLHVGTYHRHYLIKVFFSFLFRRFFIHQMFPDMAFQ